MSADLGGEHVILSLEDEMYYGVDRVAARVWQLVQEPRRFDSIVKTICSEFDVDEARCETDVGVFVEELERRSFVTITPAGSEAT